MINNYNYSFTKKEVDEGVGTYNFELHFNVEKDIVKEWLLLMVSDAKVDLDKRELIVHFYDKCYCNHRYSGYPDFHIDNFLKILINCPAVEIIEYDSQGNAIESMTYNIRLSDYGEKHLNGNNLDEILNKYVFKILD